LKNNKKKKRITISLIKADWKELLSHLELWFAMKKIEVITQKINLYFCLFDFLSLSLQIELLHLDLLRGLNKWEDDLGYFRLIICHSCEI